MDKAAAKTRVERIACRFACEMQQLQADGCPDFFCPVSFPCPFVSMQAVGWVEQVWSRYGADTELVWSGYGPRVRHLRQVAAFCAGSYIFFPRFPLFFRKNFLYLPNSCN